LLKGGWREYLEVVVVAIKDEDEMKAGSKEPYTVRCHATYNSLYKARAPGQVTGSGDGGDLLTKSIDTIK
jgi:hypothetical protein